MGVENRSWLAPDWQGSPSSVVDDLGGEPYDQRGFSGLIRWLVFCQGERQMPLFEVETDAPVQKVEELKNLAYQRCPGVYCLANPIPLNVEIKLNE